MSIKDLVVKRAHSIDETKMSVINIRVRYELKQKWREFCKKNSIAQQASFEAIMLAIMEDDG